MPRKVHDAEAFISDLGEALMDLLDTSIVFQEGYNELYEVDTNSLSLTLQVESERVVIRSIDVHGKTGLGSTVIEMLHECADEHGYDLYAVHVQDSVKGFWIKMGYEEASEPGTFIRECP